MFSFELIIMDSWRKSWENYSNAIEKMKSICSTLNVKLKAKVSRPFVPQQNNSDDCGIFMLKYIESYFTNRKENTKMKQWFSVNFAEKYRQDIKKNILKLNQDININLTLTQEKYKTENQNETKNVIIPKAETLSRARKQAKPFQYYEEILLNKKRMLPNIMLKSKSKKQ
jgi:Ulp1 family protease